MRKTTYSKKNSTNLKPVQYLRKVSRSAAVILAVVVALTGLYALKSHLNAVADTTACQSPAPYGTDTLPAQIPVAGSGVIDSGGTPYYIWVRMKTTAASTSPSVGLQVGGTCYSVGGVTITPNSWTWVNYQGGDPSSIMQQALTPYTSYNMELFGTQSGVSVDQVILLTDLSCNPNNKPTNYCTSGQPSDPGASQPQVIPSGGTSPTSTTTPTISINFPVVPSSSSAIVSGTSTQFSALASEAGSTTNIKQVQFEVVPLVNGLANGVVTNAGTTTTASNGVYSVNWNSLAVADGNYNLIAVVLDNSYNSATATEPITIANSTCNGPTIPPIGLTDTDATPLSNKVDLSWGSGTAAVNCQLAGYHIYRSGGSSSVELYPNGTGLTYSDTSVQPGTTYA